ncbi:MAG: phenylalanine--tRNA ligase subunit beta [Sphaerochaeta sp.]|jgi:phenylalanyl-tRNA synthetase beta chain|uniref:phenylalanine--tRNA ligase subunit beta n=1 Tax=Sphaerochaeta sp. TaxID=1972642 RepID=UPI002A360212|nr:phenylalanine--tRNA ligase subunit beta [Sphaerochaeta sp.]MDX9823481.1 phenylalanine--tRNA ligase subunit beta [Sphaerochaeta sp.]
MPKIETTGRLFFSLLGKTLRDSELEALLPVAKAELDGYEGDVLKIELNDTNRPDLWSAAGIVRLLKSYEKEEVVLYDFFSTADETFDSEGRSLIVDASVKEVRPFSIGFAARGHKVSEDDLEALIQSQEKLCSNFGRKRKTIAMGIYRSDLIKYPVHYRGADPDTTSFVPLGMEQELTLRQICTEHPKGKEYGPIVSGHKLFPFLHDDNNDVLSFPPVINSDRIGAVEVGDENLFLELSGMDLKDLLLAASIMACDMSDMGFEILPVKVILGEETEFGSEITVPYYFQEPVSCSMAQIHKTLGMKLSSTEVVKALKRMGMHAICDNDVVYATVAEYRNDFLHPVDLIEDVMIGHGLNKFEPEMPQDFTVGRLSPAEEMGRKVKDLMVGLGFQEMMYNYLGSKREYVDNMNFPQEKCIFISNPMSENYEVVRPSIIPSLLESESVSAHAPFPHKIFEVGKVAFRDERDNSGTTTRNTLGFLASDSVMGYNDVSSLVNTLLYFLGKEFSLATLEGDARFIEGRCARIMIGQIEVGVFGEIHPQVLENWGSIMPTIACEIDLDLVMAD